MIILTAQLLSGHTLETRAAPELPANVLQHLGLAASDLETPSVETFDKVVSKLQETLGLLETARYRLARYGDRTPLIVPSLRKSHCVRCHKEYAKSQNTNQACVIAHWGEPVRLYEHGEGSTWEWSGCCTTESDERDDLDTHEACFEGRHTTTPDNVEYVSEDEEDEDEEDAQEDAAEPKPKYDDDDGVRTCRQRGCARDSVKRQRRD